MTPELHKVILAAYRGRTQAELSDLTGKAGSYYSMWTRRVPVDDVQYNEDGKIKRYQAYPDDERVMELLAPLVQDAGPYNETVRSEDVYDPRAVAAGMAEPPIPAPVMGNTSPPPRPSITGTGAATATDLERVRAESERRFNEKHRRARAKKHQTIRLPHGPVCLVFLGDQHIGNAGSDIARMYRERDLILNTPGTFAWMMGDVVDNFIVGRLMAQNMKPSTPVWEQWALAKDYLHSFEDKLVAAVGGNHGAWTQMLTGVDYRRDVTPEGVLYDGDEIKADVLVGSARFPVWARHQWRGSSIYNQTHGQERAARFNDPAFTFYVGAHLHTGAVIREFIHEGRRKAAIQIGAHKRHDDYALRLGFPESDGSTGCALILHDDGTWFGCADLQAAHHYMVSVYGRVAA